MSVRLLLITILVLGGAGRARAEDDAAEIAETRKAVERSLPFIEQKGVAWMGDRGCVTCHQTTFLVWTHAEAKRRGLAVDERKLSEWTNWALLKVISGEDGSTSQGADTFSQLLLGRDPRAALTAKPAKWNRTIDPYENVLKDLLKDQTANGSWEAGGQSGNPPDIPTGWALYALAAREELLKADDATNPSKNANPGLVRIFTANNQALPKSRDRALAWYKTVKEDKARDLNEQLVVRLLVEKTYGKLERVKERIRDLAVRQNADGGWTANPALNKESDAFATGQSLYALIRSGVAVDDPAIQKGRDFLLKAQRKDGSWEVLTPTFHPKTGKGRDANTDAVYTYWGTAWAALGLLHTLPE
jgi:Squalene-hopene cyclase C-terminal domain